MIKLLIQKFVPNAEQTSQPKVRERYSVLAGVLGIICNTFLFGIKLVIGTLMNSIAIISDAFNNLSDMGSSLVSIIGARMSNRRPDKEHPFGHGRIEYISAFIVAFLIMAVAVELGKSSIEKIINPEDVVFSWPLMGILIASLLIKLWMFSYNRYIGRTINSGVMRAASRDSINDVIATATVIVSTIVGVYVDFPIDGIAGVLVSAFILYSGFDIARDTISVLLGTPPSKELLAQIRAVAYESEYILGIHDLIVHDYGPGRIMASFHAEVDQDKDILKLHEEIDDAERRIRDRLGIDVVIHMDPIALHCPETDRLRDMVTGILTGIDPQLSLHDFRMVVGEGHTNLIFDMVVPMSYTKKQASDLLEQIQQAVWRENKRYNIVVVVDHDYTS